MNSLSSDPIQLIAVSAPPFTIIRVYVPIAAGEIAIEELLSRQRQNTHNHHHRHRAYSRCRRRGQLEIYLLTTSGGEREAIRYRFRVIDCPILNKLFSMEEPLPATVTERQQSAPHVHHPSVQASSSGAAAAHPPSPA